MISINHQPTNTFTHDDDFTVENYRGLLRLALMGWPVADYTNIPWGERFILWRHDLDYSINRSLALARVERQEGLKATYFVNFSAPRDDTARASCGNGAKANSYHFISFLETGCSTSIRSGNICVHRWRTDEASLIGMGGAAALRELLFNGIFGAG
jgi:hypothetical protein